MASTATTPSADAPPLPLNSTGRGTLRQWWALVKSAASAWSEDYAPSMGAALSYYTVFSLAPLLLIVISVAGIFFGDEAARGEIFGQLRDLMGDSAAAAIQSLLASVNKPFEGLTATIVGVAVLLIGATTVFGELQDALDRIWRAPARDRSGGIWGLVRTRLLSFGMILGIAFLLMVSLVLSAVLSALGKWWGGAFGGWPILAQVLNLVIGFALTTGVFAMIYKLMPRVKVRWHDVWIGAGVTALLFTIGKFLIGLYIGRSGVASTFGAAGSLVIVFLWVYYSAQIFLLGAEFTWVYARTFGSLRDMGQPDKPVDVPVASASTDANDAARTAGAAVQAGSPRAKPVPAAAAATAPRGPGPHEAAASLARIGLAAALALGLRLVSKRLRR